MKKSVLTTLIALLICVSQSALASEVKATDIVFEKGIYKYDGEKYTGDIVGFYDSGRIKFRYNVVKGTLHGEAWKYYESGKVELKMSYAFGKLYDEFEAYHENGTLMMQMNVKDINVSKGENIEELKLTNNPSSELKDKGDATVVFYTSKGKEVRSSKELCISQDFSFKVLKGDKTLYSN